METKQWDFTFNLYYAVYNVHINFLVSNNSVYSSSAFDESPSVIRLGVPDFSSASMIPISFPPDVPKLAAAPRPPPACAPGWPAASPPRLTVRRPLPLSSPSVASEPCPCFFFFFLTEDLPAVFLPPPPLGPCKPPFVSHIQLQFGYGCAVNSTTHLSLRC